MELWLGCGLVLIENFGHWNGGWNQVTIFQQSRIFFAQLGVDLNHETMIENLGYWDGNQNPITTSQWSRFFQNNHNF
jgi:hypothetical protein